jgi:predicted dehydrogenase
MELDPAFDYRGLRMRVKKGTKTTQIYLPEVNHFAKEMDHFSEAVLDDKPVWTPGEDGLADIRVIEAIHRSLESGKSEKV